MAKLAVGDKLECGFTIDANYCNELLLAHDVTLTGSSTYSVWAIEGSVIGKVQRFFEEREAAERYFCEQICVKDERMPNEISNQTLRELWDSSSYTILIEYKQGTLAMNVYVNGELKRDIKQITITAQDMRPPTTYDCEMYMPPPAIV